ncbi:hypothetical protein THRCLA_22324 [Thraustotheca clavata]|uniref:Uncharacterized protein n=1 Tax=Thraustotheca clavata TaxID=74557 RepID=A0A1V9Z5H9_9STRA|nr:hypothetical protein THRCLA_22324 [Thraustotheca clavata]
MNFADDEILYLIFDYLYHSKHYNSMTQLLLESGFDPVWQCGPNSTIAQLRYYLLHGEFTLALELFTPLQKNHPSSYKVIESCICKVALIEACLRLDPIPSRLEWLTRAEENGTWWKSIVFSHSPSNDPKLMSWNLAKERYECYTAVISEMRDIPQETTYYNMPPLHLKKYASKISPEIETPESKEWLIPSSFHHALRLEVKHRPEKCINLLTKSLEIPKATFNLEYVKTKDYGCQTQIDMKNTPTQTTLDFITHSVFVQTVEPSYNTSTTQTNKEEPISSSEIDTQTMNSEIKSATTQTIQYNTRSNGSQSDILALLAQNASCQTTLNFTTDMMTQTSCLEVKDIAVQFQGFTTTQANVQTQSIILCDIGSQTNFAVEIDEKPKPLQLLSSTPSSKESNPTASSDFILLSMAEASPKLVDRNDMVKLEASNRNTAQKPLTMESVAISVGSIAYEQVTSAANAVVVAETKESQAVRAMQVSHHGKYLLIGTNARAVRVLNIRDALAKKDKTTKSSLPLLPVVNEHYKHHNGPIYSAAWNYNDTMIATGSTDGVIHLTSPFQLERQLSKLRENTKAPEAISKVRCLTFAPSNKLLASGGGYDDAIVRLWDLETSTVSSHLPGHSSELNSVQYQTPHLILSASQDRTVRLWDVRSGCCEKLLKLHSPAQSIAISPSPGIQFASGHQDGRVSTWDLRTRLVPISSKQLMVPTQEKCCRPVLEWSPHGQWLLLGGYDGTLAVTTSSLHEIASYADTINTGLLQVAWHPTIPAFLTSDATKSVKLWLV